MSCDISNKPAHQRANNSKHIFIVAGEASGDILGASLIQALRKYYPKAKFSGLGGPLMIKQGLEEYYPMERLSVMGVVPILSRLPELLRMRKRLAKEILSKKADCFIGIDAPVFNTELEYQLKKQGVLTIHYVSPSVWAWRENRIYKIVKSVSLMICLFPFELDIYKLHKLPAICIGHPLADEIPIDTNPEKIRSSLQLSAEKKILAILPGSRGSEMKFLMQPFFEAASHLCEQYPDLQIVTPCANAKRRVQLEKFFNENEFNFPIKIFDGQSRDVMLAANYVLLASGTATLEALLLKKPMVVAYKVSKFSYWLYAKLLKIKNFALPNLLAKKNLVTELIQDDCSIENIKREINHLIDLGENRELIEEYHQIHLGLKIGGSKKAAEAIYKIMEKNNG